MDQAKQAKLKKELQRAGDFAHAAANSVAAMDANGTLKSSIEGVVGHFTTVLEEIDAGGAVDPGGSGPNPPIVFPVWPGRPVIDESTVARLNTDLDGLPLPERPYVNYSLPRSGSYALTLNNQVRDMAHGMLSHVNSSGAILRNRAALLNAVICAIGKDGIKGDGGPGPGDWLIMGCHIFGIPLDDQAHGDAFQNEGNFIRLHIGDTFLDVPGSVSMIPGAEWSNACMQMDNKQGDAGLVTIERTIFRGGNFSVNVADKGTGKSLPTFKFKAAAFIVEPGSPQFGLFDSMPPGRYEFDDDCAVYELRNGICHRINAGIEEYNWGMTHK